MPPKKTSPNNSLLLRGDTWHIHWNVPKGLRSNPLFRGKAIYSKTLRTKDVHDARKMRDKLVKEFTTMVEESAEQASRRAFLAHYAEAKKAREELQARLIYMDEDEEISAVEGFDAVFCVESALKKEDRVRADAYLAAIHDKVDVAETYAITLKEAAWEFIKEHEGSIAAATISRTKKATESLLKAIGNKEVKLKDVTARQVTRWIKAIASESSDNTRAAYLTTLHKMWQWTWEHEHVDGVSPFKGIRIERQCQSASKNDQGSASKIDQG